MCYMLGTLRHPETLIQALSFLRIVRRRGRPETSCDTITLAFNV